MSQYKLIDREGLFDVEVVDCYIQSGFRGTCHIVEYRIFGETEVFTHVERCSERTLVNGPEPGTVVLTPTLPRFSAGERLCLKTRRVTTKSGLFTAHRWFRGVSPLPSSESRNTRDSEGFER